MATTSVLVQYAIARLLQLWPGERIADSTRAEYNRQGAREWQNVRDFLLLHYVTNGRDEPFWRACRESALPDSLAHRIELFRNSGWITRRGDELFTELAWLQVLIGQGINPGHHHPLAEGISAEELEQFLTLVRQHAGGIVARMPPHQHYLAVPHRSSAATDPQS